MKPILALLAAALCAAPAAQAQDTRAALLAQIDALPMDDMCSARGVFQYGFGGTDAPPNPLSMMDMNKQPLPAAAAPFEQVALVSTKWSNRFAGATYELDVADEATALAVIERLARHFRARGWIAKENVDDADFSLIDSGPEPGGVNFYSEAAAMAGDDRKGIRVALHPSGEKVVFECEDMAMIVLNVREALGDLPEGTPKPVRPAALRPEALDPEACATPAGLAQYAAIAGGKPDAMTRYVMERANYNERITTWKSDRLKKSGKVSSDRLLRLALTGLEKGGGGGNLLAGFGQVLEMFADAGEVARLERAGNREGACRAAFKLMKNFETIDALMAKQWSAMEAVLDAEARRVGVSFD